MRAGAFSKSGPRPRPRLPVHARLPSRMAYEKEAGSDSVRRGRSAYRPGAARLAGRTRQAIALGPEQKPRAKARRTRRPFTAFLALLADLATILLNDVSIGNSESFKLAAARRPDKKRHSIPSASIRGACSQKLAGRTRRIAFLPREACLSAP